MQGIVYYVHGYGAPIRKFNDRIAAFRYASQIKNPRVEMHIPGVKHAYTYSWYGKRWE